MIVAEHEAPLVVRRWAAQKEAVPVEQPELAGEAGGPLVQFAEQGGTEIVEYKDTVLAALPVEDGSGEAEHRLERALDDVVFDVEVERRQKDLIAAKAQGRAK